MLNFSPQKSSWQTTRPNSGVNTTESLINNIQLCNTSQCVLCVILLVEFRIVWGLRRFTQFSSSPLLLFVADKSLQRTRERRWIDWREVLCRRRVRFRAASGWRERRSSMTQSGLEERRRVSRRNRSWSGLDWNTRSTDLWQVCVTGV